MNDTSYNKLVIIISIVSIILSVLLESYFIAITAVGLLTMFYYIQVSELDDKHEKEKEHLVEKLEIKLEKTKKESEESLEQFISLSKVLGSGVIHVNTAGIIDFANKDIELLFYEDINNRAYESIKNIKPLYAFINEAYLKEKSIRQQFGYENRTLDVKSRPLFEQGIFTGCLIVIHDISSLKTAENFQKQFTADVTHELRTPLSAIKGFSEILLRDHDIDPKERTEFLELMAKEANRMDTILSDLLVISKMDRLDHDMKLKEEDMKQVIEDITTSLKTNAKRKNLDFTTNINSQIMLIDRIKMEHVIMNLIKNAINYTDKGTIAVNAYTKDDNYVIEVSDTGVGISKEDQLSIFKRFYRVDKTRSRDTGGSGLGLSITKNVVLRHNGTISVDSRENEGSTFTVTLPIKK